MHDCPRQYVVLASLEAHFCQLPFFAIASDQNQGRLL